MDDGVGAGKQGGGGEEECSSLWVHHARVMEWVDRFKTAFKHGDDF